ncbi:MAG TPA: DUF885 family protein [Rhodanobacteraceae bacterium]|jgi:uncharacterized protein (DUF885 family)|nr:DUF885 family protein [Rhodanobacteraceae bacterium]
MNRIARTTMALALVAAFGATAAHAAAGDVPARVKALNALLAEQWEYQLKESPEFATILGDYRYNDRFSDLSLAHAQKQKKDAQAFIARFEAIDTTGFDEQDRLNQQLMVRQLKDGVRSVDLKLIEMPVDQFNGIHLLLAQFVSALPFDSTKHYEDYVARLNQVPRVIDQLIEVLKQGQKDKLMPPRFLLEKVVTQCQSIADPAGEASVFGRPAVKFADSVPEADRKRLHDAVIAAVDGKVRPAYGKLGDFIAKEYAPKGRAEPGLWSLPNGDALYRYDVEHQTTTNKSPEEIHQLGLAEVARIEAEQSKVAQQLGYKDLPSMRAALEKDPKTHATSRQQIVDLYKKYIDQMQPKLPELFGLLPKTKVEVLPVEEFREKEASGAQYNQGTPDGSRPGRVYVNTYDFANRTTTNIETTAYHEGVPGHHMQISIAQTLPGLPPFRQQAGYNAYAEGWALYSERLGKEVGFFQDPLSYYGHLSDELLRANRLVLDTGVHYKHWTRQQMVDYFHAHSSQDEPSVQSETDRYIAYPGQALSYKMGQLKILELRERAKTQLGAKFDIRAFHDEILNGGALPLDVLEARTDAWIASKK